MFKLSNVKLLSVGVVLLSLVLLAKMIALGLWWYLPNEGVDLHLKQSYGVKYQRVDFHNMLRRANKPKAQPQVHPVQNAANINTMLLSGLYGTKTHGFAIVAKRSRPKKTTIVSVGEKYMGYTLKEILQNSVVFTRNGKEYILLLEGKKQKKGSPYVQKVTTRNTQEGNEFEVSKSDINYYSKNPSQIWKDIAISEMRKNGKITGFRVNRIRPNSKMAQIGLRVGDLIIKANNVELKSYRDAIKLYNDIDTIDEIELVVIRNNQEKEIIYEIR